MTLNEFIKSFDTENLVILFEGNTKVLEADTENLAELGKLLASKTDKMIFRSRNTEGSEKFFSDGVMAINHNRIQLISDKEQSNNENIDNLPEITYYQKNKGFDRHLEKYNAEGKNTLVSMAASVMRDISKISGNEKIKAASFVIFYDDLNKPMIGETAYTREICQQKNIPFINQSVWFNWLLE